MSTNAAQRLASAVRARREELDLNQIEVWQAGGPSNTKLTEVENGRTKTLTRTTARRLDIGLQWEPGSAKRVWEGGEPTPLLPKVSRKNSAWLRELIDDADGIDDDLRERLIEVLEERRRGA